MAEQLTIADLANRDWHSGRDNLRLPIRQGDHHGGGGHLGADCALAIVDSASTTAGQNQNLNWRALLGPVTIVQVVKVARAALVPNSGVTQSQGAVGTVGETSRVDGTCLGGVVKLKLIVAGDVASATGGIGNDSIVEFGKQDTVASASGALLSQRNK